MQSSSEREVRIKAIILIFLGVVFALLGFRLSGVFVQNLSDLTAFRNKVLAQGIWGILGILCAQALQILIPFIPGEISQIAGGYIYGMPLGFVVIFLGTILGVCSTFYFARWLGYPFVGALISREKMNQLQEFVQSKRAEMGLLTLFILPGIPKDTLIYIAGLMPLKPIRFFVIVILARIPGLIGTTMIGASLYSKDYPSMYWVLVLMGLMGGVGILYHKKYRQGHSKWVKQMNKKNEGKENTKKSLNAS